MKDKVSAELYTLLTTGRVLQLTLKREWYLKIACGEKKEEYREFKPFWYTRFVDRDNLRAIKKASLAFILKMAEYDDNPEQFWIEAQKAFEGCFKEYDLIIFKNGYGDVPTTIVEHKGISLKTGQERWGAEAKQFYFTHKLGNVLYSEPCS